MVNKEDFLQIKEKIEAKIWAIEWAPEQELRIIFLQRSWRAITELSAICGLLGAFYTFYFVDILHFTETMIMKSYKWCKEVNLILMERNGMR